MIKGVSKDEPIVTNEQGGGQSRTLYDFTLADPKAMFEMCKVLKEGADKYGAENWRLIDIEDHLNHLIIHAYAYLAGDRSDEHLSHIMCRALFAQGVAVQTDEDIERLCVQLNQGETDGDHKWVSGTIKSSQIKQSELRIFTPEEIEALLAMEPSKAFIGGKVTPGRER